MRRFDLPQQAMQSAPVSVRRRNREVVLRRWSNRVKIFKRLFGVGQVSQAAMPCRMGYAIRLQRWGANAAQREEATMVEGIKKVGVVGAGTMGAGVAQTFAAAGYPVRLQDIGEAPLGRGMGAIKKSLERLAARGKLAPTDKDATLSRITPTTKIDDLADCDVVVEAVLERFDIKKAVMADLDRICRADAVLATNTSSISVTRIASTSKIPGRVIGMHACGAALSSSISVGSIR